MIRVTLRALLLTIPFAPLVTLAQASACRPVAETAADLLETMRMYGSDSSYAADAAVMRIPKVQAREITVVDDPAICAAAATAYRHESGRPEGVSGRVQVVRAGEVYVVMDPGFAYNPKQPAQFYVVFDKAWRALKRFGHL